VVGARKYTNEEDLPTPNALCCYTVQVRVVYYFVACHVQRTYIIYIRLNLITYTSIKRLIKCNKYIWLLIIYYFNIYIRICCYLYLANKF
jgi:hypothetical protein